jgi:hypothetical protein
MVCFPFEAVHPSDGHNQTSSDGPQPIRMWKTGGGNSGDWVAKAQCEAKGGRLVPGGGPFQPAKCVVPAYQPPKPK